jgi:dolichol-phosphate mannosyltransferase
VPVHAQRVSSQFARFAVVGASGYVVNLGTFALLDAHGAHYRVAATVAFLLAVANNFFFNRHWTFRAAHGHRGHQALRFLTVSLAAFGFGLVCLSLLVGALDVARVPAQAASVLLATPLSFVGNRLWTFRG